MCLTFIPKTLDTFRLPIPRKGIETSIPTRSQRINAGTFRLPIPRKGIETIPSLFTLARIEILSAYLFPERGLKPILWHLGHVIVSFPLTYSPKGD